MHWYGTTASSALCDKFVTEDHAFVLHMKRIYSAPAYSMHHLKHSTKTTLLQIKNNLLLSLDRGSVSILILFSCAIGMS